MDFTETPKLVMGWSNTEIVISTGFGTLYQWHLTSFKGPDEKVNYENVYGQGTTPVGVKKGRKEIPTGKMTMRKDDWIDLELTAQNQGLKVTDLVYTIVRTIGKQPTSTGDTEKTKYLEVTTFANVKISEYTDPENKEGEGELLVDATLIFGSPPLKVNTPVV